MVGLPGSGKSTWINNNMLTAPKTVIVSTDQIIDSIGSHYGLTYNELFDVISYSFAERVSAKIVEHWIKHRWNVVWDQVNLTVKSRSKRLKIVPDDYTKVAVVIDRPADHQLRLDNRRSKVIPADVLEQMIAVYQPPTLDEGFDQIINIRSQ